MNTGQIENLLRSDCKLSLTFDGVYASDRIPSMTGITTELVVNEDPSSKPGSHWVAIRIENQNAEYFDSYGRPPSVVNIVNFLNRNSKSWTFNTKELQALGSSVCGHYCVWFLSQRARGKTMRDVQSQFSNNANLNDVTVEKLVETRYGKIGREHIYKPHIQGCICRYI